MSKKLINLSNLQKFLSKLNEKFALKKAMKGISEDAEGNIIIGEEGLVPTPDENSKGKFLRSDGEWAVPGDSPLYDSMTIEEGVAGVSKVDRVLNAKNLKQIVNSDGFLTSLDSSKLTGIINIENLPQGALERILIVSSKEERLTLLDTDVQLGDVVKEADTGLMYYVINTEKLNSEEGYTQFTAGSASSVPWSGVTDKPLIPTKTSDLTNDSDFAVDGDVVHKSGNETIGGNKVFRDTLFRKSDITTIFGDVVYRFEDSNNSPCGYIQNNVHYWQNNLHNRPLAHNNTSGKEIYLDIISRDDGTGTVNIGGDVTSIDNISGVSSDTNSAIVATMGWVNNPATSTNVVHRSGDEYINGTKLFSNTIHRYADLTTSGGEQVYAFTDTNPNGCGHIFNNVHWGGDCIYNRHGAYNNKSGKTMEITIASNDDGFGMVSIDGTATKGNLETVTPATGHTAIATMGWVNNPATSTNVVHRSGNETINGIKTFTSDINFKNNYIDLTVTPTNTLYSNFIFRDKNGLSVSYIQYAKRNVEPDVLGLYINDKDKNLHGLQITSNNYVLPMGNNIYSLGSPGNKWAKVYSDDVVHTSGNETIAGSKTFSNQMYLGGGGTSYGLISAKDNNSILRLFGGASAGTGANLDLYGENLSSGGFSLRARTSDKIVGLDGKTDGTLKWNGKDVALDENLVHKSGNETIDGIKTFSNRVSFPSGYWITTDTNDNSLRIIRDGTGHGNNFKVIITGDTGKFYAPNGFIGNLQGNADTSTSSTYATTQATSDNSTKIATTAWVRTYVNSVVGSSAVGSSISAYYSNATTLTATGDSASLGGYYPDDHSNYIDISPKVGTIYTGSQLFGTLNASASGTINKTGPSNSPIYQTTAKATATFSGAFSASAKYLCTTANAVKFRAYVSQGTTSAMGSPSVVDNSSAKSIFIRVQ